MVKAIAPILFLIVAVSLFFFYTDPTYTQTKALKAEAVAYDAALQKAAELQARKEALVTKFNSFPPADIERLQKLLPDAIDNVRLALDLDGIAQRYNMRVKGLEVDDNADAPDPGVVAASTVPYETVLISFSISGTYQDLLSFLSDIEKSLRIVDIVELNFDAHEGAVHDYKVTVQTYWLK